MKRILSILTSLAIVSSFAIPAFAQENSDQYTDLTVKISCSSNPPSVTITNNSSFPAKIISMNIEIKASDLTSLANLKSSQFLKPVVSKKTLPDGQSFTITAKHTLSQNESFLAIVSSSDFSVIKPGQGKATSVETGCNNNINTSMLPINGDITGTSYVESVPHMPATGGNGMAKYMRAAVAADIAIM